MKERGKTYYNEPLERPASYLEGRKDVQLLKDSRIEINNSVKQPEILKPDRNRPKMRVEIRKGLKQNVQYGPVTLARLWPEPKASDPEVTSWLAICRSRGAESGPCRKEEAL